ncbi:MAG: hypothetical protein JO053_06575, partial [Acidobacteria bacterium]|nr:hypothetical protein [Acidobacteriota bacterium]
MKKSSIVKGVIKKAATPRHAYRAYQRQRSKNRVERSAEDPQLKLIARICPGDFLNYGHFENTELSGADLSVSDILRAQTLNAELLTALVRDGETNILDAGCGMGGITRLLRERGLQPVALSPNA